MRAIVNENPKMVIKLLKNIVLGINSMIESYTNLYSSEELMMFRDILELINIQIDKIKDGSHKKDQVEEVLKYENILKPYVFRCWDLEVNREYKYTSWLKEDKLKDKPKILSATFSKDVNDTFCDARYGINYEVSINGFLGACNKDAATIIEDESRVSIYTIGTTEDGQIINSYNLATPIVTPVQVSDRSLNTYRLKNNEVILDNRYVRPISVTYTSENDLEMVNKISILYGIPMIFEEKTSHKK